MADQCDVERLDLRTASGVWRIEGASGTTYTVDADERLAIRQPAPGAPTGPYDGCWMHLIDVRSVAGSGVISRGLRHRWDFDPAPGQPGLEIWWIQTAVTRIALVEPGAGPQGVAGSDVEQPGAGEPLART